MTCDGHCAHVAEPTKPMMVAGAHRELNHFQRPAQVHVKAAFLGLAIQRCSAMNDRIGGADHARVIVVSKAEVRIR